MLDVVKAFEKASGIKIPYEIVARRTGDLPTLYASAALIENELGWKATKNLDDICKLGIYICCPEYLKANSHL